MTDEKKTFGTVDVSPTAVLSVAGSAINECYGVVGMAQKGLVDGLARRLSRDSRLGLNVTIEPDGITIDTHVIVEYGTRIRAVAESIQNTVKFRVEQTFGMPVKAVNVYVQGLRHADES